MVWPPTGGRAAPPPAAWKATSETGELASAAATVLMPVLQAWMTWNELSGTA